MERGHDLSVELSIAVYLFGCRDEEYFRLKILTCMLPEL